MTLSLLPVSNRKLPFGCITTKNPTGTCTCVLGAPDWRALLAIVSGPELNMYIFMPVGDFMPAGCAWATATVRSATATAAVVRAMDRFIRSLLRRPRWGVPFSEREGEPASTPPFTDRGDEGTPGPRRVDSIGRPSGPVKDLSSGETATAVLLGRRRRGPSRGL